MNVYKNYDQAQLDRQYNNRAQVPEFQEHLDRWDAMSAEAESKASILRDIRYGDLERERLDIYPSAKAGSKTLIFIHGGYWHKLDKSCFRYIGATFQDMDITTILIAYPFAPHANMSAIVTSCRKAIDWVHKNISRHNGDPDQLYLAGHSAGGHLSVMMMAQDNEYNTQALLKGVCAMSGLFNLSPICLADINQVLRLDEEAVRSYSPVRLQLSDHIPLLIAVGADESDEFIDQSRELYQHVKKSNNNTRLVELQGINHYSIVETLVAAGSVLSKAMMDLLARK